MNKLQKMWRRCAHPASNLSVSDFTRIESSYGFVSTSQDHSLNYATCLTAHSFDEDSQCWKLQVRSLDPNYNNLRFRNLTTSAVVDIMDALRDDRQYMSFEDRVRFTTQSISRFRRAEDFWYERTAFQGMRFANILASLLNQPKYNDGNAPRLGIAKHMGEM